MIPLRDSVRPRRFAVVNTLLILTNLAIFAYQLTLNRVQMAGLLRQFGVIPFRYTQDTTFFLTLGGTIPLVTAMFLHGGWFHVLGNMLYLFVFGDNVEDRMGPSRYLAFYLLAGVIGNVAHILANPASTMPAIGASGAVAGVLGAYLVSFPRARILALLPLVFIWTLTEVPAIFFLLLWFVLQLLRGVAALGAAGRLADTVAWWAHIGGFLSGMVLIRFFRRKRVRWYK